jgi:hypothetical protein
MTKSSNEQGLSRSRSNHLNQRSRNAELSRGPTGRVQFYGHPGDFDIYVSSDEPYTRATAHSATNTYSYETSGSRSALIYLWYQSSGEAVTVTVGAATCHTGDP